MRHVEFVVGSQEHVGLNMTKRNNGSSRRMDRVQKMENDRRRMVNMERFSLASLGALCFMWEVSLGR